MFNTVVNIKLCLLKYTLNHICLNLPLNLPQYKNIYHGEKYCKTTPKEAHFSKRAI